jgi:hexosaminidase
VDTRRASRRGPWLSCPLAAVLLVGATATAVASPASAAPDSALQQILPVPAKVTPKPGVTYTLTPDTEIEVGSADAAEVGEYLAGILRPSTGYRLPVTRSSSGNGITLLLNGADASAGDEGYQLDVSTGSVVLRAKTASGLFSGVQTLRQLLPAQIESRSRQAGPWTAPGAGIVDHPRFRYRGAMLDVARHFFSVNEVERYIDQIAAYKINYLHLHLTDDQGWRIEIKSWPRLATYGGSTEVGGTPGGYYTQEQYKALVAYAQSRNITVVPEIDIPGHTNAALASYAELNCDGEARPLYTGTDVGFSSLCVSKDITYEFIDDVLGELAALTPGPYLHIGGDEAHATSAPDYLKFMDRVLPLVTEHGKAAMGWQEIAKTEPDTSAVPQYWGTTSSSPDIAAAAARGNKILLSPANKVYLDAKYDKNTKLGQDWAGLVEVDDAYDWNPGTYLQDVKECSVRGVEAPLWTATMDKSADVEYMSFPRLPAVAELGWSPASTHDWGAFSKRLGAQAPRWKALGINYYASPLVPWKSGVDRS